MTDFKDPDHTGNWEIFLDCPMCDFAEVVYYVTQPPIYCSRACKQRAYRQRKAKAKLRNNRRVTFLLEEFAHDHGFQSPELRAIESILVQWGEDAANEAVELAIMTARAIKEDYLQRALRRGLR